MKYILFYVTLDLSDNLTEMCAVKNWINVRLEQLFLSMVVV